MIKMTIGFSPCPNDTFIFDALVNKKIDTDNISFEPILEDVETLNQWALEEKLDITKLSFPAYFRMMHSYQLLHAGGAMGKGVGPLLIAGSEKTFSENDINNARIILPGIHTTANLLFSFAYPKAINKTYHLFHEIEDIVANNTDTLGVIIHENRFTYQQKGLYKVLDLGEHWETAMKAPVPLGGIVIKKKLGDAMRDTVNNLIKKSVEHAFKNYPSLPDFVSSHAQSMSEGVMRQHIELYVNDYTSDLGTEGVRAIQAMQSVFEKINKQA